MRRTEAARFLPEGIAGVLAVARGVPYQAFHEGERVGLVFHVRDRVVVRRAVHIDGAELDDPISRGFQSPAQLGRERGLGSVTK